MTRVPGLEPISMQRQIVNSSMEMQRSKSHPAPGLRNASTFIAVKRNRQTPPKEIRNVRIIWRLIAAFFSLGAVKYFAKPPNNAIARVRRMKLMSILHPQARQFEAQSGQFGGLPDIRA